jgi:hypothetical protein
VCAVLLFLIFLLGVSPGLALQCGEAIAPVRSCEPAPTGSVVIPSSWEELTEIAVKLRERVDLGLKQRYRFVGIGPSNFQDEEEDPAQPPLFE